MQFLFSLKRISILEKILVIFFFLAFGWLLSKEGGLQGSDNLYYMQVGIDHIKDPLILNRYIHVYFIGLFSWLAHSYIFGFRIYYAFLISVTGVLIYFLARSFTYRSTVINGVLAVALYLGMPYITLSAGNPDVDLAAAMMVMFFLAFYLFSVRNNHRYPWALMILGALYFLAFKTKETTLFSGIVLLGIGFQEGRNFNWRFFWNNSLRVAIGLLIGVLMFITLNTLVLKDPFFSLRPSDYLSFASNYSSFSSYNIDPHSWFNAYLTTVILGPFLFYVFSGLKAREENLPVALKLVWAIPLLLVAFLTFTEIKSNWGVLERYFYPAIPVVCFLAPQFIDYQPQTKRDWILVGSGAVILSGLAVGLSKILSPAVYRVNWSYDNFLLTIISPLALCGILLILFLFRRFNTKTFLLLLALFIMFNYYPLVDNERNLMVTKDAQIEYESRIRPLSTFQSQLNISPDMLFLVSGNIANILRVSNRVELYTLFNYYFYTDTIRNNYKIAQNNDAISTELNTQPYLYALMTTDEWNAISQMQESNQVQSQYSVIEDQNTRLVLLKRREESYGNQN